MDELSNNRGIKVNNHDQNESADYLDSSDDNLDKYEDIILKDNTYYYGLFEAILFLSNNPLPLSFFVKNFGMDFKNAKIILDSIADEYEERGRGILLKEMPGGYQFITRNIFAEDIRRVLFFNKKEGLSKGMLETLSIIAYKQPIILAQIDELRGVSSRMMLAKLMKRNLIKPIGRKELPGRPLLYGTTDEFLKQFGLKSLLDLPNLSEIEEFYSEEDDK